MTKVKICGNTRPEDVKLAVSLGADYVGFIFAESKRKIDIPRAQEMMKAVPGFKNFVGVFFNQPKVEVKKIAEELDLRWLQFHGEETARYCKFFVEKGYSVIKTFRIRDTMSHKRLDEYDVSAIMFDTFDKDMKGGTGKTFDWNLIEDRPYVHEKLFLSGGLNPDNVREAILKVRPFAVDISSGVEAAPGQKDPELLKTFIQIAKESLPAHASKGSVRS
ncbi:MAG: phosphoribosylanthranilate isomerase [Candidatus Omnitrophica bacterium]|nr:phosphoribosylanthranilate isomerase [Candidatus Omnitrophota bacterium]